MQDISISDPIDIDKDGNSITLMDIVQDDENILDSIDLSIQSQKLYHFIEQNLDQDLSLDRVAQAEDSDLSVWIIQCPSSATARGG